MEVSTTIERHGEKVARSAPATVEYPSAPFRLPVGIEDGTGQVVGWHAATGDWQQLWSVLSTSQYQGTAGSINLSSDYGPLLPYVGSSSSIVDRRSLQNQPAVYVALSGDAVEARPVRERLAELQAALSLNKSQLARILQVTRPTIYEWYEGKEPNATNSQRIATLLRVLARAAVSGARPLNARFVRQPMGLTEPSLLDLLCQEPLDRERTACALERTRDLGAAANRMSETREDRLRALGFEELDRDQRKELLARNIALQDWPQQ